MLLMSPGFERGGTPLILGTQPQKDQDVTYSLNIGKQLFSLFLGVG